MYITNLDELVPLLRTQLRKYTTTQLGLDPGVKEFCCPVHNDSNPSMKFNPKTNDETAHCFSCNATLDIFSMCAQLEGLPANGPEWVTTTIPHLADSLGIDVQLGEATTADRERLKLHKLAQDINDILDATTLNENYVDEREWRNGHLTIGSISEENLVSLLTDRGWIASDINASLMVRSSSTSFFGEDKVTFAIKDYRGRPIGFISRNLVIKKPKYVNSYESVIYNKSKTLMGLDVARRHAKEDGLYIVEGSGELAQLYRNDMLNVAAVCGTAFTTDHFELLKMLGIRTLYFCLDWDAAGVTATQKILNHALRGVSGFNLFVIGAPETGETDPDDLVKNQGISAFKGLKKHPAFDWMLEQSSENEPPDVICARMVPIVAAEQAAVKRELLVRSLVEHTGISFHAIQTDVKAIRDNKFSERKEKLTAAAGMYMKQVNSDPDNLMAALSEHERTVQGIESEYHRDLMGVNYQLSRWRAVQQVRELNAKDGALPTEFKMNHQTFFAQAMSGGMPWTTGALGYVGGRANSGKTTVVLSIGIDIALSDPDAIVIIHSTDDSYAQIEPRITTNFARMIDPHNPVDIGLVVNPNLEVLNKERKLKQLAQARGELESALSNERLVVIDSEDGKTTSVLERHIRYYRQRNPSKKVMVIADNTHNYMDFLNMDTRTRFTLISNAQKNICTQYHAAMIATAEYRKQMGFSDRSKIRWPVDDDLAEARSLTYLPNMIMHVYNDLHDREEDADIFYRRPRENKPLPRLVLNFTKNKLTSFKDKLVLDLDPISVSVTQYDRDLALEEAKRVYESKQSQDEEEWPRRDNGKNRDDNRPKKHSPVRASIRVAADEFGG